jgi:adenylate cyclase
VIYGNVGAPDRLDFTVMGPAVNRTARLESLTKKLGCNILFSEKFAELVETPSEFLGQHEMKGIAEPQAVYALCKV